MLLDTDHLARCSTNWVFSFGKGCDAQRGWPKQHKEVPFWLGTGLEQAGESLAILQGPSEGHMLQLVLETGWSQKGWKMSWWWGNGIDSHLLELLAHPLCVQRLKTNASLSRLAFPLQTEKSVTEGLRLTVRSVMFSIIGESDGIEVGSLHLHPYGADLFCSGAISESAKASDWFR